MSIPELMSRAWRTDLVPPGSPAECKPELQRLDRAYLVPSGILSFDELVYDSEGRLVTSSVTARGRPLESESNPPSELPEPLRNDAVYIDGVHLQVGTFRRAHFGHWLTEGLSRLWPLLTSDSTLVPVLSSSPSTRTIDRYRSAIRSPRNRWTNTLGLVGEVKHISRSKTYQFRTLLAPQPSMLNRHSILPTHLLTTRSVGRIVLNRFGRGSSSGAKAIYLSRRKLRHDPRRINNEAEVELLLAKVGVKVLFPEQMNLAEQIKLFDQTEILIGQRSSAFHTMLLGQNEDPKIVVYLSDSDMNNNWSHNLPEQKISNFDLIDSLLRNEVYDFPCLRKSSMAGRLATGVELLAARLEAGVKEGLS